MIDPFTKMSVPNITCPKCRFRHPAEWTCKFASEVAASQRTEPEPAPPSLWVRTHAAIDQLTRYGDAVQSEELVAVLEQLTDINDDLAHGRDPQLIKEGVEKAKALLDLVLT